MSDKITFDDFLRKEGDSGVRKLALEYARGNGITLENLAKRYNMSRYTIRQLLDCAIVHGLISYQDSVLMKEKAHMNQLRHIGNANDALTKSDMYYEKLLQSRREIIKLWENSRVEVIVDLYLTSPLESAQEIATSQGLSKEELNVVLKKSIVFCIIDDNTTKELINYTTAKADVNKRLGVWKKLNELMAARKEYQLASARVDELEDKLKEFPDFYFEEEENSFEFQKMKLETEKSIAEKHLEDVLCEAYSLLD